MIEIIIKNKVYGYQKLSKSLWILSLLNRGGVWKRRTLNAGGSMVGRWARRWTPGFHGPRLRALSFTRSTFVGGWCLANHAVLRSHVVNKRLSQVQSAVSIDMGITRRRTHFSHSGLWQFNATAPQLCFTPKSFIQLYVSLT